MPLKASPNDQSHLLELQELDTRLRQLDHKAKTLPQIVELASLASEATRLRQEVTSASGALEDAKLELSRVESDVAVVESRIARDTERMQASSSMKDVAGFESELAGLHRRHIDLEEMELGVMERVENLESAAAQARSSYEALQLRITELEGERDTALAALTSERAHSAANRSTIAGKLPADLIALYERQRERYGFGASLLRGGVSAASGVKLNENDMATIRSAAPDDVLLCPDSQAILVRTAESGI